MHHNDVQQKTGLPRFRHVTPCEFKLCLIVWEQGPLSSSELRELCLERFQWSKSTTFTYIRRLGEKGILVNEDAMVRMLVSKETVQQARLDMFIEREFEGSPAALLCVLKRMYQNGTQKVPVEMFEKGS